MKHTLDETYDVVWESLRGKLSGDLDYDDLEIIARAMGVEFAPSFGHLDIGEAFVVVDDPDDTLVKISEEGAVYALAANAEAILMYTQVDRDCKIRVVELSGT